MTLSLKNLVHHFLYGSRRNGSGTGTTHHGDRAMRFAKSYREIALGERGDAQDGA
jgi:hypothetical protein